MKNNFFLYILILLSFDCFTHISHALDRKKNSSAILCKPNNGRFGDQLICYSRAKWLSHKFNLQLFYMPFNYSDQLMLHEQETIYLPHFDQLFSNIINLPINFTNKLLRNNNTLYITYWKVKADIDWDDDIFLEQLRSNICPRYTLNKIIVPEEYISVAAHVRNGGGFHADSAQTREEKPLQFVSEEFFIEQIERLAEMFPQQNLYVHIFTDHQNPNVLKKRFEQALANPRIIIGCREQNNSHSSNVLEDFFSMMDFDCLIRPSSNFSKMVQYIGNNKVIIYPSSSYKNAQGKSVINTITIKRRAEIGDAWITNTITV